MSRFWLLIVTWIESITCSQLLRSGSSQFVFFGSNVGHQPISGGFSAPINDRQLKEDLMNHGLILTQGELSDILHDLNIWTNLIPRAFSLAEEVHGDQRRSGGGPYLEEHIYPVTASVARYLAYRGNDDAVTTVIVSLLHDTIEDSTTVTAHSIEAEFGGVVAEQVAVLSKPQKRPGASPNPSDVEEAQYVTRVASAAFEVRVIKVFDRLNNLHSVHHRESSRRRAYLNETRTHYIALARTIDDDLASQMVELLNKQESRFMQESPG